MATVQQLETALLKAHRAGDTRSAQAIADEIKRVRGQEQPTRAKSFGEGVLSGFETVVAAPGNWLTSGLAALGDPQAQRAIAGRNKGNLAKEARLADVKRAHPNWFTGGELVGETVATAPFLSGAGSLIEGAGGALARVAPRVGGAVAKVGRATATGGIGSGRTAAQTAKLTLAQRAGDLAARSAGGAIAGAGGAALTDQDVSTGAMVGGALPGAAALTGKIGGRIVDMFRSDKVRAAQMFREALGTDLEAARAAFANMAPDDQRMARQILIDEKIEPDTFMALGADVERLKPTDVRLKLEAEDAARNAALAEAAGGGTATETRAAVETGRKNVSAEMTPQREAALGQANVAGAIVPDAERLAAAIRQRADEMTASGFVPRMRGLAERSSEQAQIMGDNPALFPDMENIQRTRGIAGAADTRADDYMQQQIALRTRASALEDAASQLAAEGMAPLKVAPIVQQIRIMANQPGTRASKLQRNALTSIADHLEGLANRDGVINAKDLYQVRKTELNDTISSLLSGQQPSSGVKEAASGLLGQIKPMIDDAIEKAGGAGWKDYLAKSATGYQQVAQQELAGHAAGLARAKNPDEFLALMGGERPKAVEAIMGLGQYDINALSADPARYLALKNAENQFLGRNRMGELAQSGAVAANKLMASETPKKLQAATRVAMAASPSGRNIAQGTEQFVSEFMKPKIGEKLAEGFMGGKSANELLNAYPSSLLSDEYLSRLSPMQRNALAQMLRGYAMPSNNPNAGY